ncbi:disease resistance protein RGA2-like [Cucurbita moschata]|uniref:Disease resistance protein RGA2-like n=1 Tax=Cucurbita moschata TaxID=3662 RepID=A0A6J1EBR1_CUCMO|nr:disease resistance protein RGA2-like [Cucurbita moschata]
MKDSLLMAQAIPRDVEKMKVDLDSLKLWVKKLEDIVFQADILLNELAYEDVRLKVEIGKDLLYKKIPPRCVATTFRIGVIGRDTEVSNIVDKLLALKNQETHVVLPIVGTGGLGKTILVKEVFHHDMIKEEFRYNYMAKEIWDYLKAEYEGDERICGMKVLNLIRDFKLQKMKESELVKEYFDRLLSVANKVRLLGYVLGDSKIVEKLLVTVLEKFKAIITTLENTKDLSNISLTELLNALQAQEQMRSMRQEGVIHHANVGEDLTPNAPNVNQLGREAVIYKVKGQVKEVDAQGKESSGS